MENKKEQRRLNNTAGILIAGIVGILFFIGVALAIHRGFSNASEQVARIESRIQP